MAGFKIRILTAGPHVVGDLGIVLDSAGAAPVTEDHTSLPPQDVARSADLLALITSSDIVIVDARDDTDATFLSMADSTQAVENHNDTHLGVSGGRFGALDDPTVVLSDDFIVQYDLGSDSYESIDPATLVTQTTVQEAIEDIVGAMGINGTDTTFTYLDGAGTIEWSVNDVFLRNTGDTLDSGTLTIASGAAVDFPTGSTITIAGDVTAATIVTPAGGFTGGTDLINKDYVDSLAGGFDYKESVRVSSTPADGDITGGSFGGTYSAVGGPTGTGEFTTVDLSAGTGDTLDGLNFTGTSSTGLVVGDRVLIKDQADATQNGIYEITAGPATSATLTRAEDQDGSPASEVSGGNTTFVEDTTAIFAGSTNSNSRWSVLGDGLLTLNTDDIDWTITGGADVITDGIGISKSSNILDLDVSDLVAATPVSGDFIAFHDLDGAAETSGSQTRNVTFADALDALQVPNAIGTGTGIVVKTADGSPDTYTTRTLAIEGAGNLDGLSLSDPAGIGGDPTFGLDIQNLPVRSDAVDTTDRVAVWNVTTDANEYYTVAEIAGAVSASDSFVTWTGAGNTTGDGSIVADSSADTVTVTGGIGINVDLTALTDIITWSFTRAGMADIAVTAADTVPFFDATNSNEPEYRAWSDIITDLGILTSGNQVAFTSVTGDSGTATADTNTDTISLTGATSGGITTVASDTPENVTFAITGADLATGGATLATGDFIIVNDSTDAATTVSLKYTFGTMITDLGILTDSNQVAFTSVTGDTGTATADTNTDSLSLAGALNGGITTIATDGPELVTFSVTPIDLTTGAATLALGDFFIVSDASDTSSTIALKYTFQDLVDDLEIVNSVGTGTGIVVKTADGPPDTYTTRSIDASADEDELGITITNGDGVSGNPTVGLDIVGLTDPGDDMAATDEFPVHDKSEGSTGPAGANRKMTGQNIADGVATILNLDNGLGFSTINGQEILTFDDPTRASKTLSIDSNSYTYSDNSIPDGGWVEIGNAIDTDAGHIMPFNGTVVGVTAMTENANGSTHELDLFINGAIDTAGIATLTGTGVDTDIDMTLNIDFAQGDRLRLQVDRTVGSTDIQDIVVNLIVRWRA